MRNQRFDLNDKYEVIIKINPNVSPPRPIYDAEMSMILLDKKSRKEMFHISNYHWHPTDKLGKKLSGHPSMKIKTGRKIFLNLSEGQNPKKMSFDSLKDNFINECCSKIGENYRDKLKEILDKIELN